MRFFCILIVYVYAVVQKKNMNEGMELVEHIMQYDLPARPLSLNKIRKKAQNAGNHSFQIKIQETRINLRKRSPGCFLSHLSMDALPKLFLKNSIVVERYVKEKINASKRQSVNRLPIFFVLRLLCKGLLSWSFFLY